MPVGPRTATKRKRKTKMAIAKLFALDANAMISFYSLVFDGKSPIHDAQINNICAYQKTFKVYGS